MSGKTRSGHGDPHFLKTVIKNKRRDMRNGEVQKWVGNSIIGSYMIHVVH